MRDDNEWLDLQLLFVFLSICDASIVRSTAGTKSRFGLKRFTGPVTYGTILTCAPAI